MCFCVWLLFWIANICNNIIWDPTNGALTSSSNQRLCATSHQPLAMDKTHPHNRLQPTYIYTCPTSQGSNGHAHVLCIVLLSNLPNHIPFLSFLILWTHSLDHGFHMLLEIQHHYLLLTVALCTTTAKTTTCGPLGLPCRGNEMMGSWV